MYQVLAYSSEEYRARKSYSLWTIIVEDIYNEPVRPIL